MVERWNGTVAQMLTTFVDEHEKNWDEMVPYVVFAFNTSKHAATKVTPFELIYGRKVTTPMEVALGIGATRERSTVDYAQEVVIKLKEGLRAAKEASDKMKRAQERRQLKAAEEAHSHEYKIGDKVWLDIRQTEKGESKKFAKKFEGPYEVTMVHTNYITIKKHDGKEAKVHVERVKLFKERDLSASEDEAEAQEAADEGEEIAVIPDQSQLLPNDLIGKRVRVYWSGEKKWFDGLVTKRNKRQHIVEYDDGDVKSERLLGYSQRIAPPWKLLVRRRSDVSL
jgi:hypothetical protein